MDELLTAKEVAALLKKSHSFVLKSRRKWSTLGIASVRVGGTKRGRLLFRRRAIDRLLEQWIERGAEISNDTKYGEDVVKTSG